MKTFAALGLRRELLDALDDLGFTKPTAIQEKTIPHFLENEGDLVALAPTGTGKTAGFSLPILETINPDTKNVQAIVLCPTRELCLQITKDIKSFTKYMKNISTLAVYGGENIVIQLKALKKNPQIVVGTPGRVLDLIKRKKLILDNIEWLVLDEADEMLNMGFKEDMDAILEKTPEEKNTLLFSATMPRSVAEIAKNYMKDPYEIRVNAQERGTSNIDHKYFLVHSRDRFLALRRIMDAAPDIYGIVFCRTRRETQEVADKLMQHKYSAEPLHGDIVQEQRTHIMNRFRKKQIRILVATDVAARGIDVDDLTHVINYNLPDAIETYVHRSGRTGRAGSSGVSMLLLTVSEKHKIRQLEKKIGKSFEKGHIPTGELICKKQMFGLIDKITDVHVNEDEIAPYLHDIYKKFEHLSREDIIKQFVSMEFNRFIELYRDAPDINVTGKQAEGRNPNKNISFCTLLINIGAQDKFGVKELLGLINKQKALSGVEIGKIEVGDGMTYFEIDKDYEAAALSSLKEAKHKGRKLTVTKSKTFIKGSSSKKGRGDRGRGGRGQDRGRGGKRYGNRSDRDDRNAFRGKKKKGHRKGGARRS